MGLIVWEELSNTLIVNNNFSHRKRLSDKIVRTTAITSINPLKQGNPRHLRPLDTTANRDIRCFGLVLEKTAVEKVKKVTQEIEKEFYPLFIG